MPSTHYPNYYRSQQTIKCELQFWSFPTPLYNNQSEAEQGYYVCRVKEMPSFLIFQDSELIIGAAQGIDPYLLLCSQCSTHWAEKFYNIKCF